MKKVIVADSSANLYRDESRYFVPVPMKVVAGDKEYIDDEMLNAAEMLDDLQAYDGRSGSSCPSVGDWMSAFGDAEEVIGISITSHLSGCYNAANVASEFYVSEHPDKKVFILDSLSTGPEMELLVEKCQELLESGASFEYVKEELQQYLCRTHLLFSLESLSNFAKNGRVSPALAAIANLLESALWAAPAVRANWNRCTNAGERSGPSASSGAACRRQAMQAGKSASGILTIRMRQKSFPERSSAAILTPTLRSA